MTTVDESYKYIPAWPGGRSGDSRTPAVGITNRTVQSIHAQLRQVAAANRQFGAIFGETWVTCRPDVVEEFNGHVYLRSIVCVGEVDEVVEVEIADTTYVSGDPEGSASYRGDWSVGGTFPGLPYAAQSGEIYRFNGLYYVVKTPFNVTATTGANTPTGTNYRGYFDRVYASTNVNSYVGDLAQGVDPLMVELFGPGYTETLVGDFYGTPYGLCYVTAKIPATELTGGWPTLKVRVRGWKCYDPRSQQTVFTRNPALQLATAIASPIVGWGIPVEGAGVIEAANRCDDAFPDGPRIECNLEIGGNPVATDQWMETLRGYAGVLLDYRNGVYHFVVDAPRAIDWHIAFGDHRSDMEMMSLPDIDLIPATARKNVITVRYTNTDTKPWKELLITEESPAVQASAEVVRLQEYRMAGIVVPEQALRYAKERLAEHQLETWLSTVPVRDEGANVSLGQVLRLTTPNGFDGATARVMGKSRVDVGMWLLRCRQYNADAYEESA